MLIEVGFKIQVEWRIIKLYATLKDAVSITRPVLIVDRSLLMTVNTITRFCLFAGTI